MWNTYTHAITIGKKEAMNFKSGEGYMGGFEGGKEDEEMLCLNYNLKNF